MSNAGNAGNADNVGNAGKVGGGGGVLLNALDKAVSASAPSPPSLPLRRGDRITVTGTSRDELNGQCGTVQVRFNRLYSTYIECRVYTQVKSSDSRFLKCII